MAKVQNTLELRLVKSPEKHIQILEIVFGIWKKCIFAPYEIHTVRIFSKSTLVEYYTKNPQSRQPLEDWYLITSKANWQNLRTSEKCSTM